MPSFAKDTASKTGSSTTTVKREVQIANSITAPVKEAIRNTPVADSKTDLMQLAKLDEPEQEAVAKVIAGGKAKNVKDAVKIVRREQKAAEEEIAASAPRDTSAYRLIQCPLAEVALDDMQADWIITDPPYPKDFLSLYDDLASFAEQHLKPGGSLLALVGQSYLPEVMARLTGRLRYQWTLAYLTPGGQSVQLWDRHVNTFWKPVLWFVKGEYKGDWVGDVIKSDVNDNDKRHHHWGQSESGMADLIWRFTHPGEMIIDPFLGGGTTGVVAVTMGRQFIGIDIDEAAIEKSARRLETSKSA